MSTAVVTADRRVHPRYKYRGEVRFEQQLSDGVRQIGSGTTEDLSRQCVRFRAEERLAPGTELVLRMAWPELLQNVCGLELLVRGVVTRVNSRGTLMSIASYEFRTCGVRSFSEPLETSSNGQLA